MGKLRVHNEWFQPVSKQAYGGGSRCPCGKSKRDRIQEGLEPSLYAWGEYSATRWHCVDYFCQACFHTRVIPRLVSHAGDCGCTFSLNARSGHSIPSWIKMPEQVCAA